MHLHLSVELRAGLAAVLFCCESFAPERLRGHVRVCASKREKGDVGPRNASVVGDHMPAVEASAACFTLCMNKAYSLSEI